MLCSLIWQDPGERLVKLLIVVFEIFLIESHLEDELIEGFDEVALKQLLVHEGFANELANELK